LRVRHWSVYCIKTADSTTLISLLHKDSWQYDIDQFTV
jgi:hypothetical protein